MCVNKKLRRPCCHDCSDPVEIVALRAGYKSCCPFLPPGRVRFSCWFSRTPAGKENPVIWQLPEYLCSTRRIPACIFMTVIFRRAVVEILPFFLSLSLHYFKDQIDFSISAESLGNLRRRRLFSY